MKPADEKAPLLRSGSSGSSGSSLKSYGSRGDLAGTSTSAKESKEAGLPPSIAKKSKPSKTGHSFKDIVSNFFDTVASFDYGIGARSFFDMGKFNIKVGLSDFDSTISVHEGKKYHIAEMYE